MSKGAAPEKKLTELHGALAEAMRAKLAEGDYTASDLGVIRQFLKDNGINAEGDQDESVKSLAADLPEDIDESVVPLRRGQ